jgi:hypothetical protein
MEELISGVRTMGGEDYIVVGNGAYTRAEYGNGAMLETFSVKGWEGEEDPERWGDEIDFYRFWERAGKEPRLFLVNSNTFNTNRIDYPDMRFGLAGTLLGDGYYSYDFGSLEHGQSWWFDEYDNAGSGKGYLGQPLGGAYSVTDPLSTPEMLTNGGFEQPLEDGWGTHIDEGYNASINRETVGARSGAGAVHILNETPGTDWHLQLNQPGVSLQAGDEYTFTFWARASSPRYMRTSMRKRESPYTCYGLSRSFFLDSRWRRFQGSFECRETDPRALLQLHFGEAAGDVWVDDVSFRKGSIEIYRRNFEGGTVICNATAADRRVDLEKSYWRIGGSQDPATNDGCEVREVTVPAGDGVILVDDARRAATTWYFAEGSTGGEFETWILVGNPSEQEASVQFSHMTSEGMVPGGEIALPPGSRATLNPASTVPDEYSVSTVVTSDSPVVAERAMYWGDRRGGHDSIGVTSPATSWHLAEGSTGGEFETWILVGNPSEQEAKADLVFMTETGTVPGPSLNLEPYTRKTVDASVYLPDTWSFSTVVTSDGPVVAERATYWKNREGGHASVGYPLRVANPL